MLLDTNLDAPGLRRMKMETRTADGPEGAPPAFPQAYNMHCSRFGCTLIVGGTCLISYETSQSDGCS